MTNLRFGEEFVPHRGEFFTAFDISGVQGGIRAIFNGMPSFDIPQFWIVSRTEFYSDFDMPEVQDSPELNQEGFVYVSAPAFMEFDDLTRPEFRSSLSEFTQWIELVGKLFAMKGSPELIYCYITALKP